MYGYGFRPFEFRPPDRTPNVSNLRKQELDHGMAALRSFLLPRAYVMVTWLLELLGASFTPFVVWKVAHVVVTSALSLAVYRYVIAVFRSHDTACLASVLCAVCTTLHVLGTHTLVNSLLAPPVFLALSHLHSLVTSPKTNVISVAEQSDVQATNGLSSHFSSASRNYGKASQKKNGKTTHRNGYSKQNHGSGYVETINGTFCLKDINDNVCVNHSALTHGKQMIERSQADTSSTAMDEEFAFQNGHAFLKGHVKSQEENCGHLVENAIRDTVVSSNTRFSNFISWWISPGSTEVRGSMCACLMGHAQNLTAGMVLGICCYIRTDLVALVVATLLPNWLPYNTQYLNLFVSFCGALGGICLGILEDFRCYGWGVLTPLNWFKFNVENDYSTSFFGETSHDVYVVGIFFQNYGMVALTCASVIGGVVSVFCSTPQGDHGRSADIKRRRPEETRRCTSTVNPADSGGSQRSRRVQSIVSLVATRLPIGWACLLLLYLSKGHKELRFVHNVIVLVIITYAAALHAGLKQLCATRHTRLCALYVGVACFAFSQWHDLMTLTDSRGLGGNKFAFKRSGDTQDLNVCLHYISTQTDVTGVFLDKNLYASAGYTILHKNVSVFTVFNNNFHEYSAEDRLTYTSHNLIGQVKNVSVAYLSHVSNYVSLLNAQYMLKFVLEDARYNYLVVLRERNFAQFGFAESVFQYGAFKVLKRPSEREVTGRILQLAARIAPLRNATVLLHEADTLLWHGAWARAADRFKVALGVDPNTVAAYSPLAYCYKMLGDVQRFTATLTECYERFGQAACDKPRGLVKLK